MKNKSVLLTGATGFLGSYLLEALIKMEYKTIILKRSFSNIWRIENLLKKVKSYNIDKDDLSKIFKENKINLIIHTATNYGRKGEKASDVIHTNLLFPLKLIEIAISYKVDFFLNTDTLLPYKFLTYYTLSKKQFVEWLRKFSDKINVINLKIENFYGPKDDEDKFVNWLISQMISEKEEIKLTEGRQMRDFIYILDVVEAYITILNNQHLIKNFNEFDIGTGNFISIYDFVNKTKQIVEKISGRKIKAHLNFGALPYREGDTVEIKEDISAISQLGWKPKVSLEEGLMATIKYYLKKRQ